MHDNLRHLGLDALDVVNLRAGGQFGPNDDSIAEPLSVLAALQTKGLIRHIGLSNISGGQFAEGEKAAKIVCVQNHYNLAQRRDDVLIDDLAGKGIAFVPFFPLGGFRPLQSPILDEAAAALGATTTPMAVPSALHGAAAQQALHLEAIAHVETEQRNVRSARDQLQRLHSVESRIEFCSARFRCEEQRRRNENQ